MKCNEPGTTQGGRILDAFVILLPLLVAATKLLPGMPAIHITELLGSTVSAILAHALAALSLVRTILGARRTAAVSDWLLQRVLGERIAGRFRGAPAVGDLIVSACQERRGHNG